jgi:O-antigen/teichoic acid export membrane protein
MRPDSSESIASRTLRGAAWAYGSYLGGRLLVLASTAILARLLTPAEFGLVALALIFIALLETVSDLGVGQALVIVREDVLEHAETAFTLSVLLGAGLACATAAIAPLAALFFGERTLVALLPVLGGNFLLRSLGTTHYALAQRRMDFRSRTAAELTEVAVRGVVGIALAVAGLGAWSLVLGYLAGSLALTAVLWALVPWRPSFTLRRERVRGLWRFGGALTALDAIAAVIANVDYVFVGRILGTASLGLYSLGFRLPELMILNLSVVAGQVLFPAFAALDSRALGDAFVASLRFTLMVAAPAAVGLAVLAEPLTLAFFGDQWRDAIPVMQVLTLYALGVAAGIPAGSAYKAVGLVRTLLALAIPRAGLLVAALALFGSRGIAAVATCQAAVAVAFAAVGIALASRLLGVAVGRLWGAAWPSLAAATGMIAVLVPLERAIGRPWPAVLAGALGGGLAYVALLCAFDRPSLKRLVATALRTPESPEGAVTGAVPTASAGGGGPS